MGAERFITATACPACGMMMSPYVDHVCPTRTATGRTPWPQERFDDWARLQAALADLRTALAAADPRTAGGLVLWPESHWAAVHSAITRLLGDAPPTTEAETP